MPSTPPVPRDYLTTLGATARWVLWRTQHLASLGGAEASHQVLVRPRSRVVRKAVVMRQSGLGVIDVPAVVASCSASPTFAVARGQGVVVATLSVATTP